MLRKPPMKPTTKRASAMRKAFEKRYVHLGRSLEATIAWTAFAAGAAWQRRRKP